MAAVVASCQPLLVPIPDSPENLPELRPRERGCRNPAFDGDDLYFQATDHQSQEKNRCDIIDAAVSDVVEWQDLEVVAAAVASGSTSLSWPETPTQPSDLCAQISTRSRAVIFVGNSVRFCFSVKVVCPTGEAGWSELRKSVVIFSKVREFREMKKIIIVVVSGMRGNGLVGSVRVDRRESVEKV